MKKTWGLIICIVLGIAVVVLGVFIAVNSAHISRNQRIDNNELVAVIKEYQHQAKFHQVALAGLIKIAEKAKFNKDAIKFAGYIIANVGFNTVPVFEIANLAGNVDHEVKYLKDLMEVTITYGGDSDNMVNLAKKAVNNEISEVDLLAKITFYRNNSQAKTIDEAIKYNEKALAGLTKTIEEAVKDIERQKDKQPQTRANDPGNAQLIAEIKGYMNGGKKNQNLEELLKIAANAAYNQSVIQTAANFLSKEGSFNDWTVTMIARLAGGANREIKELNDLLEVSIIYGGDGFRIVGLAIKTVKNDISEAELEKEIANYRNNSEAKTIDEALENHKKTMAGF